MILSGQDEPRYQLPSGYYAGAYMDMKKSRYSGIIMVEARGVERVFSISQPVSNRKNRINQYIKTPYAARGFGNFIVKFGILQLCQISGCIIVFFGVWSTLVYFYPLFNPF